MTASAPDKDATKAKKRRKWPWIAGGLVVLIIIIAVASGNGGDKQEPVGAPAGNDLTHSSAPAAGAADNATPAEHTVVYKVTGSGKASTITYNTDGMATQNQESNVKVPWSKTIKLPAGEALQFVQILAQGASESAKITATIEVDGKVVKEANATGYGVASANANIGSLGG